MHFSIRPRMCKKVNINVSYDFILTDDKVDNLIFDFRVENLHVCKHTRSFGDSSSTAE